MNSSKVKSLFIVLIVFTLVFCSSSTVFAAKPIQSMSVLRGDPTTNSLTVVVSWENILASRISIEVREYDIYNNPLGGKYYWGEVFDKKIKSLSDMIHYATWEDPATTGNGLKAIVTLYDKKGRVLKVSESTMVPIP